MATLTKATPGRKPNRRAPAKPRKFDLVDRATGEVIPSTAYQLQFRETYEWKAKEASAALLPRLIDIAQNDKGIAAIQAIKELNSRAWGAVPQSVNVDAKVTHMTYAESLRALAKTIDGDFRDVTSYQADADEE